MNIAFPALLIGLLILPGIVFRYSYARGSWGWTSPVSFRTMSDELAYSAIFAVGLHFLWLLLASLFEYGADIRSLLALLSGNFGPNAQTYRYALDSIANNTLPIAAYFLSLTGAAAIGGRFGHYLVRKTSLDRRTQIFRFKNEWYYLLSGEVLSFHENNDRREVDGVFLSAVVDHAKESFLYRGIVRDWSFDAEGNLDSIRLSQAHRRKLESDKTDTSQPKPGEYVGPDDRYYQIRGDLFVLRYDEMKTINLDYFELAETAQDTAVRQETL